MQLPIHKLLTKQGVPVYIEQYPNVVMPMSIILCMMSGSADDGDVGVNGLHHWGEHLPFRGTVSFPRGPAQIMGHLSHLGGYANAMTQQKNTVYIGVAPKTHWRDAAERVVDMAARPLNRPEDIEAERTIIGQEINQGNADIDRRNFYHILRSIWSGHPFGRNVVGSSESLAVMDLAAIQRMHKVSYGCERCSLLVAGDLDPDEVVTYTEQLLEHMPTGVSPRHMPHVYDPLPAWQGGVPSVEESEFDASIVSLAFPMPALGPESDVDRVYTLLTGLFTTGMLDSPLYRIVRGERQLAYHTQARSYGSRNGGVFRLAAKTSRDKADQVAQAFWDVIHLPELRSQGRWDLMRETMIARHTMRLPNPEEGTERMLESLMDSCVVDTEDRAFEQLLSVSRATVLAELDKMTEQTGRVISLLGK
jgi:zinc protease